MAHPPEEYSREDCEQLTASEVNISALPDHTMEDILARIPLHSLGFSANVCKRWRSVTSSPTFLALYSQKQEQSESWVYVNGFRYRITDTASAEAHSIAGHVSSYYASGPETSGFSWGAGGLPYVLLDQQKLQYKLGFLYKQWVQTPELNYPRTSPIVAVVKGLRNGSHKVVCAGGLSSADESPLSKVEVFDSESRTWEECEELPAALQGIATTSRSISAVVCNQKVYLFHINSGIVASLNVETKRWSSVTALRPASQQGASEAVGMESYYLAVWNGELLLVGVSYDRSKYLFRGWKVDESSMVCTGPPQPVLCHFASCRKPALGGASACKKKQAAARQSSVPAPDFSKSHCSLSIARCKSTLLAGIKVFDSFRRLSTGQSYN